MRRAGRASGDADRQALYHIFILPGLMSLFL